MADEEFESILAALPRGSKVPNEFDPLELRGLLENRQDLWLDLRDQRGRLALIERSHMCEVFIPALVQFDHLQNGLRRNDGTQQRKVYFCFVRQPNHFQ